ncbi:PGPGW domain-containing protein [Enemella sp. A6]|uniref:PGPGW domain-containing protein n=1 Tax=Enemella sp. A6 TaxID=3440152 RepID=UPI003EBB4851
MAAEEPTPPTDKIDEPATTDTSAETDASGGIHSADQPKKHGWSHHPHLHLPRVRSDGDVPLLLDKTDDRWEWRRKIREDPRKAFFYRLGVGILGGLLIIAGPITGPLPGPGGIPLVLLGLAVWSSEFEWAQRLAVWFKRKVHQYRGMRWRWKLLILLAFFMVIWLIWYVGLVIVGIPAWVPEWAREWLLQLPGVE